MLWSEYEWLIVTNVEVSPKDPGQISNKFCEFFTEVGHKYAEKIPKSTKTFEHYIKLKRKQNNKTLFLSPPDSNEILEIIKSLKQKKSCSDDNISSILIKLIANNISGPISTFINKSIMTGTVPEHMKIAKIIPIYKSKSKDDFSNYRPISILPTISKILEKVIYKRLYNFMNTSNTFYANQYGFRHRHSTLHAVTKLVTDIVKNNDNKESTLSMF